MSNKTISDTIRKRVCMYYDFHTHLYMYDRIEAVIEEIDDEEIFTISASVDIESYTQNKKISCLSPLIIPTFGIHPSKAIRYENRLKELDKYISDSSIIGEIGLDYLWVNPINRDSQKNVFHYIAKKAVTQDKYIVIHTKNAESDILDILTDLNAKKVIIHWYSGPVDLYKEYMSLGWYSTFGVEAKTSTHIQRLINLTPHDRLLTETDSPVGIEWLYGNPGMPSDILDVYNSLSKITALSDIEFKNLISDNASRILQKV